MAKILFLPIYDPSHHRVSVENKRGLRDALIAAGYQVVQLDYCEIPQNDLFTCLIQLVNEFQPDLLLTQLQGVDRIDAKFAFNFRTRVHGLKWVNFNQDYWPEHLLSQEMRELLGHIDLQLVSNGSVLPDYIETGIRAAYWPFAYETPVRPLPDVPHHDIVFLGNAYSDHRRKLGKLLKSLPYNVGLYGSGWEDADGDCNYDFTYGEALYKNAKIAISDNEFTDAVGYLSNRPFQILAAGGAVMLQQVVKDITTYTGLIPGKHYWGWDDDWHLEEYIKWAMTRPEMFREIAAKGQTFVREHHSYDVRVRELMAMVEGIRV